MKQKQLILKSLMAALVMWSINPAWVPTLKKAVSITDSALVLMGKSESKKERQKNTLEKLEDLHVSPQSATLNSWSEYHIMSYMALWKNIFLSNYISVIVCREVCCSITLLLLVFQVSLGYSYLFYPSAPPLSASKWTIQTRGKYGHIHM